ncbi:uncharacterized protein TNCV_3346601 [Trichonephila clavipes]|nr:uncharacterized protein TNCV_3346601 [Trichonephila clavipes]
MDSDLQSNPLSETSLFAAGWRCSQEHSVNIPALPQSFELNEAHFWLNGYVNKQNCRIWSEANPQVYVETPLHPEKPTVWCALWSDGIIGPYFFKNDEGQIGLHPSQPWQSYARNHI